MKKNLTIILATLVLVCGANVTTYAAFPTRSTHSETTHSLTHKSFAERKVPQFVSHIVALSFPDHAKKDTKGEKSGWEGIVSLVCGIAGLITLPIFFSSAAIVFGILGMNSRKHSNTGLAIAGLILGGIGLIYFLAVVGK